MRRMPIVVGLFWLSVSTSWPQVQINEMDFYPWVEIHSTSCAKTADQPQISFTHVSLLAGLVSWETGLDWFKVRVAPILYQRHKNEHMIQPIAYGGADYTYDSRKGVRQVLAQLETDLAYTALLAWRTHSDGDPYLSGGFTALFGELMGNYGFKSLEGNHYRACALTEAIVYANDEKYGRQFFAIGGVVLSTAWDRPGQSKTWHAGLVANGLCLGRESGKMYGRLLWVPIGGAPSVRGQLPLLRALPRVRQMVRQLMTGEEGGGQ